MVIKNSQAEMLVFLFLKDVLIENFHCYLQNMSNLELEEKLKRSVFLKYKKLLNQVTYSLLMVN